MEVFVHMPKKKETLSELEKRVSTIHAQAVLERVRKLECPMEQKIALIRAVQEQLRYTDSQ